MVLHDIDPQRLFKRGEQKELFEDITDPPPGANAWYNPPQGIRRVLNQQKPVARLPQRAALKPVLQSLFDPATAVPTTPYEFVIYGDSSLVTNANPGIHRAIGVRDQVSQIELLSKQLIRTVAINGVAPIVAVRDNAHWIVVNGFHVEDDYRDEDLRQRDKIKAILIRNPLGRYTYSTTDCSSLPGQEIQVITGHECQMNPHVQDVVPFATWVREYMFSDWAETFVEVCDSSTQVADNNLSQIHCLASRTRRISWLSAICNWIARVFQAICSIFPKKQITENDACDRAKREIENFKLSDIVNFYQAIARPSEHYIAPFDDHPNFGDLISGKKSRLSGKKIRLTDAGPELTITSVSRDATTPYVWRPTPKSFSASRPFHNLKLTVQERQTPISLYLPVDDYCLPEDSNGVSLLPPANYLEDLTDCIKQGAGSLADEVLVQIDRRGTTALVMYKSNQIKKPIEKELDKMKNIICQCLIAHPYPGLTYFRIKAFATDAFLTKQYGGGEGGPIGTAPPSGGGDDGFSINECN
jgi:hypothetical protein